MSELSGSMRVVVEWGLLGSVVLKLTHAGAVSE
jgi:hypothetical protein